MLRFLVAVSLLHLAVSQIGDVFVDISSGTVKGQSFLLPDIIPGSKVINRFHGIPYAAPPVGDRRFRPPEPPAPFEDVFIADTLPDACPQGFGLLALTHPFWDRFSEDCLYINVFAPSDPSGGPYPVMVYLHGGGYTGSANIQYPGHFHAGYDVVVAVPNYRLGHLGFMSTGDDVAQGNWGFMDQVMALQWVQENIAAFGGDPNRVTLFGQSAGASSIGLHMISPYSRELFHQGVFQSGNELAVWAINGDAQAPQNYTKQVAGKLGCPTEDSQEMMDCLRTIDPDTLRETDFDCTPGYYCQGFAPVIDGDYVPMSPWDARDLGLANPVPILTGLCREDGSPYTLILVPEAGDGGFSRQEFLDIMRTKLVSIFTPLFPGKEEDVFQAMAYYYTPWPYTNDENYNRGMVNNMTTDFGFGVSIDQQLKYHSQVNPNTYMYLMGYRTASPSADLLFPPWMGVPHNGELPYVIGFPFYQESGELRADAEIVDVIQWDEEDQIWALYMTEMWTNFAKYGTPTPDPVTAPDGSQTSWPLWTNNTQNYLYLDRNMEYRKEYRQRNFAFWLEYLTYVSGIDFGGDIQYGAKPDAKPDKNFTPRKINSKEAEETFKKFFAPRMEELLKTKIPQNHKTATNVKNMKRPVKAKNAKKIDDLKAKPKRKPVMYKKPNVH